MRRVVRRQLVTVLALTATFTGGSAGQSRPIAITDVTVIDGTGNPSLPASTVILRRGHIAAVQSAKDALPANAVLVDGRGKFLMPGLWDMHVHLTAATAHALPLFIANGVTSVRDMGGDWDVVRSMREQVAAGRLIGPRIRAPGPILESPARVERMRRKYPNQSVERTRAPIGDSTSATRVIDSLARSGVDFVKFRTVASPEVYRWIANAAHRAGLPLTGHGDAVSPEEMIRAGQRSIEHPILRPLQWRSATDRRRIIRGLARAKIAITPTVVNFHRFFMMPYNRAVATLGDSLGKIDFRRRYVADALVQDWREQVDEDLRGRLAPLRRLVYRVVFGSVLQDLRQLHAAGVRLLPGSDVTVAFIYPGFSLHDELQYFVTDIGMTPMQALVSATRWPAEFMGLEDSLGTVRPGKIADLVLLEADPLTDIANTRRISGVVRRGEYFDRKTLDRMLQDVEAGVNAERVLRSENTRR